MDERCVPHTLQRMYHDKILLVSVNNGESDLPGSIRRGHIRHVVPGEHAPEYGIRTDFRHDMQYCFPFPEIRHAVVLRNVTFHMTGNFFGEKGSRVDAAFRELFADATSGVGLGGREEDESISTVPFR